MTEHSQRSAILVTLAIVAALTVAAAVPFTAGAVTGDESDAHAAPAPTVTASAAGEPTLVVNDATVDPDGTATQRIALTDAPDGLAGFELTLELESDVATVAGADYPDHYAMTTEPVVSADGRTVTVEAVDLNDEISAGASDVTLATLELEGVADGATDLRVTELQVDADGGDPVDPSLEAGTVTVGESAAGSDGAGSQSAETEAESTGGADGSDGADGGGDSADGDSTPASITESVPSFTAGLAIAAVAVLAAAAIARRT
ncbi:hypothetical protein [Halopiger xanaduensis]|uniref:Uncharacterized protein n=1 Tax=Halopiger xanaduensis (strain DSM 18323 / JCM 14033 / SH-6) TaxID=797210 RepID=F8D6E9_HALXS|nr:hypothetical protein [Halopiger xanaduensis]AEH36536.1 hypothetical protein Halxa_1909 [Halopiger xanaduensis SH-6]